MHTTINQEWVSRLAEELLREIMQQMGGIQLKEVPDLPKRFGQKQLGIVCGETTGDFQIRMRLEAENALFVRLAGNMIGEEPQDQQEVEDYATEVFNVVCGRFLSKLYDRTGQKARFLPPTYEEPPGKTLYNGNKVNTVKFISDSNEGAVFAWTLASQSV